MTKIERNLMVIKEFILFPSIYVPFYLQIHKGVKISRTINKIGYGRPYCKGMDLLKGIGQNTPIRPLFNNVEM